MVCGSGQSNSPAAKCPADDVSASSGRVIGRAISHSSSTSTATASRPPAITARVVRRNASCAYCSDTDTATVQALSGTGCTMPMRRVPVVGSR